MISSEVQRTLVKSPPELWAELSDPGSLARHLGELGEIRITRVEPEQLVEWEAENKTGKVYIKPSGWGTKVTLTVEGDLAGSSSPDETTLASPDTAPEPACGEATASETESSPDGAGPQPPQIQDGEANGSTARALTEESPPPTEIRREPVWPDPEDPVLAPATPAARAARRPSQEPEAAPLDESEAQARDAGIGRLEGEAGDAPTGRLEDQGSAIERPEDASLDPPGPYAWAADEGREPRRGFFARLFGWRRGASAVDTDPYGDPAQPATASGSLEPTSEDEIEQVEHFEPTAQPAAASGSLEPTSDDVIEQVEQFEPAAQPAAEGSEPATELSGEPQEPEDSLEAHQGADQIGPEASEDPVPEPPDGGPENAAIPCDEAPAAQAADGAPTQADTERHDISTELKAAEEIAAAEVTAVLTSVLDRLGAAHHRPFSRS